MHQQILAMGLTFVEEKKCKTETLICAFDYFTLSQNAYNRMR